LELFENIHKGGFFEKQPAEDRKRLLPTGMASFWTSFLNLRRLEQGVFSNKTPPSSGALRLKYAMSVVLKGGRLASDARLGWSMFLSALVYVCLMILDAGSPV